MIHNSAYKTLSIIIVNWNGMNFLPDCLKSLAENPPNVPFEIIVVDNASTDKSIEWLKSSEAKKVLKNINFRLIESKENLGFSRGNNLAIEQANSPIILLLNPDTVVKENALDSLYKTLNTEERIGACAPKLLNPDGSLQPNVWGFPLTPFVILAEGLKLYKLLPSRIRANWLFSKHWNHNEKKQVKVFSGAAIMAKMEMINEVGGLDPSLHMYGEDAEWCVRINRAGWKLFFVPEAEIIHFGGQSAIQRWSNSDKTYNEESALIVFQQKCLPNYLVGLNALTKALVLSLYVVKHQILGNNVSSLKKLFFLQLRTFRESLFNLFKNKTKTNVA